MKKSIDEIDALIKEALSKEEAHLYDEFGEQSIFEQALEVLRGKQRIVAGVTMIVTLAFVAGGVFSAIRFFQAEAIREMMMWGGAFFFFLVLVLALKIWYWMEMQRHTLSREIKRLELQVARLLEKE